MAMSGLRLSFSYEHQDRDIQQFISALQSVVRELAPMGEPVRPAKGETENETGLFDIAIWRNDAER